MSVFRMKAGDRRPFYGNYALIGGEPVALTGCTITLHVTEYRSGIHHNDFVAQADGDQVTNKGLYHYFWQEGDMEIPGRYSVVTHVVFPDGTDQTFPTVGFDSIVVGGNLS